MIYKNAFGTFKLDQEQLLNSLIYLIPARLKAVAFGQDAFSDADVGFKVDPAAIAELYREFVIPLTKQVQVRYLFERVSADPPRDDEWPASLLGYQDDLTGASGSQPTKQRTTNWM